LPLLVLAYFSLSIMSYTSLENAIFDM